MAGDGTILVRWYDSVMKNPPLVEETIDMDDEDMTWESTPKAKTDMLALALENLAALDAGLTEKYGDDVPGRAMATVVALQLGVAQVVELRRIANALEVGS